MACLLDSQEVRVAGPYLSRRAADKASDEVPWPVEALLLEGL